MVPWPGVPDQSSRGNIAAGSGWPVHQPALPGVHTRINTHLQSHISINALYYMVLEEFGVIVLIYLLNQNQCHNFHKRGLMSVVLLLFMTGVFAAEAYKQQGFS